MSRRKFKVGDIITGFYGNGYSKTNSDALMLVTSAGKRDMEVTILYHNASSSQVGRSHLVFNSKDYFSRTTFEEFSSTYTNCYKMDDIAINKLLELYPKNQEEEEGYVLSEEMRTELLEEMKELLLKYHYHPTDEALNKIIDEWCENKGDLIRLFEKHPNYNGKFQIAFDHDYDRVIDFQEIDNFRSWLSSNEVKKIFKKEIQLGVYSYDELCRICSRLNTFINMFYDYSSCKIHNINGKTLQEYDTELRHFRKFKSRYEYNDKIVIDDYSNKTYDAELYNNIYKVNNVCDILGSFNLSQFVNEKVEDYFKRRIPDAKIKEGQKMSRAIGKILRMYGVNQLEEYNARFAKFSDAINPLRVKRHTVISIHPIDYLTMSFGNSWSSCHTIDKLNDRGIDGEHQWGGQSSSGTMSYMLDGTSCIFYTVDRKYKGNHLELEDKINRCMFHYYDNQLVQGRVYPQSNDSGANDLYKNIREICQKVFADILEVPNYWTNRSGYSACCEVIESYGTHYRDYENFSNCNVSTLKDNKYYHTNIEVGHNPICPCCGKQHTRTRNIECSNCNPKN